MKSSAVISVWKAYAAKVFASTGSLKAAAQSLTKNNKHRAVFVVSGDQILCNNTVIFEVTK